MDSRPLQENEEGSMVGFPIQRLIARSPNGLSLATPKPQVACDPTTQRREDPIQYTVHRLSVIKGAVQRLLAAIFMTPMMITLPYESLRMARDTAICRDGVCLSLGDRGRGNNQNSGYQPPANTHYDMTAPAARSTIHNWPHKGLWRPVTRRADRQGQNVRARAVPPDQELLCAPRHRAMSIAHRSLGASIA
ncbi:hypothetical protein K461DRAFT_270473 [Myriangium duriaei CBS 260.36]|uniref:Uncharacterized protein n=1 Tax=Myriangium duriaei CBS 260.36 TaxID=1168546 RepID=A0A9P4MEF2_9PEZI|nr:hypothetical protein K461DRAFT_270473 [Myriangium duriaei CBS 260.36]